MGGLKKLPPTELTLAGPRITFDRMKDSMSYGCGGFIDERKNKTFVVTAEQLKAARTKYGIEINSLYGDFVSIPQQSDKQLHAVDKNGQYIPTIPRFFASLSEGIPAGYMSMVVARSPAGKSVLTKFFAAQEREQPAKKNTPQVLVIDFAMLDDKTTTQPNDKKEKSMSLQITPKFLEQLGILSGNSPTDEFEAELFEGNAELRAAIQEQLADERKNAIREASKQIIQLLKSGKERKEEVVATLRAARRKAQEAAVTIKKFEEAEAQATKHNNYIPLIELLIPGIAQLPEYAEVFAHIKSAPKVAIAAKKAVRPK